MAKNFSYHLFISYSSADRAWAEKLETDLRKKGVNCFLDQDRIKKGATWEPQLLASLINSRHFVVLWSENAKNSEWVSEELYRFKSVIDPKGASQSTEGRLLYAINLEGQNVTLAAYQGYLLEGVQQAYKDAVTNNRPISLDAAATEAWNQMVSEIAEAVTADDPAVPVPVAILAMTTKVFQASPPVVPELDFVKENDLDGFLTQLGVGKLADLGRRYGPDPLHWRPFGAGDTIQSLLTDLLNDINQKLGELKKPPIRWSPIDIVTPKLNILKQTVQPLVSGPCLLVIDPISLFSFQIWQRYVQLGTCFSNPQAAIALLTPFCGHPPLHYLRECLIGAQGKPNLDWYSEPIPYNPAYANCGINIADKWDIRRLVLASLGRQPSSQPPSGAESILGA